VKPSPNLVYNANNYLNRIKIRNLKARVDEIIAISKKDGTGAQVDTSGAVLQIDYVTDKDGKYKKNVLADLQLEIGNISLNHAITLGTLNITHDIVDWYLDGADISNVMKKGYIYKCNGDSMFHVNKGVIGLRLEGVKHLTVKRLKIYKIQNFGRLGNEKLKCKFHDDQKEQYYMGAQAIGINISACQDVLMKKFKIGKVYSENGEAIGINVMNNSQNIRLFKFLIKNIKAGRLVYKCKRKIWMGKSYYGKNVPYKSGRNKLPWAIGIKICRGCQVHLCKFKICDLKSLKKPVKILRQ